MTVKSFKGAPFGQQSLRFSTKGIHPKFKLPGADDSESNQSNLGPGSYDADERCSTFIKSRSAFELDQSNWRRKLMSERFSKMPYILNKDLFEQKEEQKRKLGPGYYDNMNNGALQCDYSIGGIMYEKAPRFKEEMRESLPGPGSYGKDGIPHLMKEENDKLRKSPSKLGIMCGNEKRPQTDIGSGVPPNRYDMTSSVEQLLSKRTGKRGPYDCFSLERGAPIKTGHYSIHPAHSLAPNHYAFKSSVDETINDPRRSNCGKFLRMKQYPDKPFDRAYWESPDRIPPDPSNQISAATYNPKTVDMEIKRHNRPPFNSSCMRSDKLSNLYFTGNYNPVAPGRYDIQLYNEIQHINSHENIFRSKTTASLPLKSQQILAERRKPKNIPTSRRLYIDHHSTEKAPRIDASLISANMQPSIKIA